MDLCRPAVTDRRLSDDTEGAEGGESEEERNGDRYAGDADNDGWERNDEQYVDERQKKQGGSGKEKPVREGCSQNCVTAGSDTPLHTYFFDVCLSWLDRVFVELLAEQIQQDGRARGQAWRHGHGR